MKNFFNTLTCGVLLSFALTSAHATTDDTHTLVIKNHFDKPLRFEIHLNPTTVPDLPNAFSLDPNSMITTKVLDEKEAYIRVKDVKKDYAYWGVEIKFDKVLVHGYLSKGIAYSWNAKTIVFCTPEEYKTKHSCL